MFCRLFYVRAPEVEDYASIYGVVIGLLTGSITSAEGLPEPFDNVNSVVDISYAAAGWSIYDNDAAGDGSATSKVLRAPFGGEVAGYKYVHMYLNHSGYYFFGRMYESWDKTIKIGLNPTKTNSTSVAINYQWREIAISVTSNYLLLINKGEEFKWASSSMRGFLFANYTPKQPWIIPNGFPLMCEVDLYATYYSGNDYDCYVPRVKNYSGAISYSAPMPLRSLGGSSLRAMPSGIFVQDGNGHDLIPTSPIIMQNENYGGYLGSITQSCDIWAPHRNLGLSPFRVETRPETGDSYVGFPMFHNGAFLFVRKG